jgi:hypothetical protein
MSDQTTITLAMRVMDDCDGATLTGILRDAIEQLPEDHRAWDFFANRGPLVATVNNTMADPWTTGLTGRVLYPCPQCGAEVGEECHPMCLDLAAEQDKATQGSRWSADEREA